jgi:hypothetical protein
VQAARDGVSTAAELASGVQDGEHDLDCGTTLRLVDVDGDATAVVSDADAAIGQDRHVDVRGVPCERLVDGVVDDLVDEVMQPAGSGGSDVHAGPFAYRFEALENLDVVGAVFWRLLGLGRFGCHM